MRDVNSLAACVPSRRKHRSDGVQFDLIGSLSVRRGHGAVQLIAHLALHAQSILTRRQVGQAPKHEAEIALVAKPYFLSNVGDREIGCREQLLRLRNPELIQENDKGLPGHLAEEAHEMRLAHVYRRGGVTDGYLFRMMKLNKIKHGMQPVQIALPLVQHRLRVADFRVMIHEQHKNHLQVGSNR